jgi:hypothetical protein
LDCNNVQANGITQGTGSVNALTLSGTRVVNPASIGFFLTQAVDVTIDDWLVTGTATEYGMSILPQVAGTITIRDGVANITSTSDSFGINCLPAAGVASSVIITGNDLTVESTAANDATGIKVKGATSVEVGNNTIHIPTATVAYGIDIPNHDTITLDSTNVYKDTIYTDTAENTGVGITVGDDANPGTTVNNITTPQIQKNVISNFNHGVLCARVTSAHVWGNTVSDVVLGVIFKVTTTCLGTGNLVINASTNALRFKGDTDSIHANSMAYNESGTAPSDPLYADQTEAVGTGSAFYNNLVFTASAPSTAMARVIAPATASFDGNLYWTDGAFPANPWVYGASTYSTITLWNAAATVGTDYSGDPALVGYALDVASPAVGAGVRWWGLDARPQGHDGHPFPDVYIDVGHLQSEHFKGHPFGGPNRRGRYI